MVSVLGDLQSGFCAAILLRSRVCSKRKQCFSFTFVRSTLPVECQNRNSVNSVKCHSCHVEKLVVETQDESKSHSYHVKNWM